MYPQVWVHLKTVPPVRILSLPYTPADDYRWEEKLDSLGKHFLITTTPQPRPHFLSLLTATLEGPTSLDPHDTPSYASSTLMTRLYLCACLPASALLLQAPQW